jgi:hypothetical protein
VAGGTSPCSEGTGTWIKSCSGLSGLPIAIGGIGATGDGLAIGSEDAESRLLSRNNIIFSIRNRTRQLLPAMTIQRNFRLTLNFPVEWMAKAFKRSFAIWNRTLPKEVG